MDYDFLGYRGLQGTNMDALKPSGMFWTKSHNQTDQECAQYYPAYSPCERNSQVSDAEHVQMWTLVRRKVNILKDKCVCKNISQLENILHGKFF